MLPMAIVRGQLNLDIFKTAVTVDLNNGIKYCFDRVFKVKMYRFEL